LRWAFASAVATAMAFAPAPSIAQDTQPTSTFNATRDYAHPTLASESTEPVTMQLGLAMDTSASMSDEEYALQLRATAHALNSRLVRSAIKYRGSVSVFVIDFGTTARLRMGWVDLRAEDLNDYPHYNMGYTGQYGEDVRLSDTPDRLDMLVQEILAMPRLESGSTRIWTGMQLSEEMFSNAPWMPVEGRVLDIFGDGTPDDQMTTNVMRQRLADIGVTINGFAIVNDVPTLEENYQRNVVTLDNTPGECFSYTFNLNADYQLPRTEEWCIDSIPGRVWAMARNVESRNNGSGNVLAFYDEVTMAMKQKISVELAGLEGYMRILAELGQEPELPVPLLPPITGNEPS